MYTLLLIMIYLAFISLGLPDSLLGAGWPVMHEEFQVPLSYMGLVSMVISGGTIVSSLLSDKLTRKFGTQIVTVVSVLLTAIALFGFSVSSQFWLLIVLAIPYGLGAGAIDAALNNYVALHYSSKHMSWLHCFWGVGTIVSPFVMSYALTTSTWTMGYRIISILQIGIVICLFVTLPLWKVNGNKVEEQMTKESIGFVDILKIKGVPTLLLGFFGYCAAEATAMSWATTYLVTVKEIHAEKAAAFASLVFIGLTIGRFVGGFLMDKLGDRKMILLGTVIALIGLGCLILPVENEIFSIIGFGIVGLGYAPIYPCIIHATPSNFGAKNSGVIIGIQMASAYIGSTFIPPLYGFLGRKIGYGILPVYLILFVVLMIYMVERTFQITAKTSEIPYEGTVVE